jgi:hypothetical protein
LVLLFFLLSRLLVLSQTEKIRSALRQITESARKAEEYRGKVSTAVSQAELAPYQEDPRSLLRAMARS